MKWFIRIGVTDTAIGQVHKYIDKLHDVAREGLAGYPHITVSG